MSVQTAFCAEDACRCWTVSAVASGRVVERVAERNCGSTIGREEKRSTMWTIERPTRAMKLQGVSFISMALIAAAIRNGSCMKGALGDGFVEQSSDELRTPPRSAGISSHLHNDHGCET